MDIPSDTVRNIYARSKPSLRRPHDTIYVRSGAAQRCGASVHVNEGLVSGSERKRVADLSLYIKG
jgi:hypothetical protein